MPTTIPSRPFYAEWSGHPIAHLDCLIHEIVVKREPCRPSFVYFAGDSSLDNKAWISGTAPACNGYEDVLRPPESKQDVCYWVNAVLEKQRADVANQSPPAADVVAVNTAIEATTVAMRSKDLLPQDQFIHKHITENDYLVVSIGGNDIAMAPTFRTVCHLLNLMYFNSTKSMDTSQSVDYFVALFKDKVEDYIKRVVGDTKPRRVLVCTIYYPDMQSSKSWASWSLKLLKYQSNPKKLQRAIDLIFERATSQVSLPNITVVPLQLSQVMDGSDTQLYDNRVEPSEEGGRRMADYIVSKLGLEREE